MKNITLIYAIIFVFVQSLTAQKQDYQWIFGGGSIRGENEIVQIDFTNGRTLKNFEKDIALRPSQVNASISSPQTGELLFYTNGCFILDRNYEVMENGDNINYGDFYQNILDCTRGYNGSQNTFIVPDPSKEHGYYVIHKKIEFIEGYMSSIGSPGIMYSYIDMSANGGLGTVVRKNVEFFRRDNLLISFNHVVQHQNGKDWWFLQMKDTTNVHYVFLIDETGPHLHDSVMIGQPFHYDTSFAGQGQFSADGSRYAMASLHGGLYIYDFDRQTGELKGRREAYIDTGFTATGLEWSSVGRFLYVSTGSQLYQVDTESPDLEQGIRWIADWDGYEDPFATQFGFMSRGPDCRIYMSSYSGTRTLHVINKPNEMGGACDFRARGLDLNGTYTGSISIPNFPNFRIDTDQYCDPDIQTSTDEIYQPAKTLRIAPNPVSSYFVLEVPYESQTGVVSVYDGNGSLVLTTQARNGEEINVEQLPTGTYSVRYVTASGEAYVGRMVKM